MLWTELYVTENIGDGYNTEPTFKEISPIEEAV